MKPPRSWALALLGWAIAVSASAQDRLPIFDTHMHYSQPAWAEYPAERILEIMTAAGVPRAAVSSSPDEGTLMLLSGSFRFCGRTATTSAPAIGWPIPAPSPILRIDCEAVVTPASASSTTTTTTWCRRQRFAA